MSVPISVGDVLLILGGILKFAKRIHDAPDDLRAAIQDLDEMESTLKILEAKIGDEQSFLSSNPKIAKTIQRDLQPLANDMNEVHDILYDFREQQSISFMGRFRYATVDKGRLRDLRRNFEGYRNRFESLQVLVLTNTQDYFRKQLEDIQEWQESDEKKRKTMVDAQKKTLAMCQKIEQQMHGLISEMPVSPTKAPPQRPEQILQQLEQELMNNGVPRTLAQERIEPLRKLLREVSTYSGTSQPKEARQPHLAVPENAQSLQRRKSDSNATRKRSSHALQAVEERPLSSASNKNPTTSMPQHNPIRAPPINAKPPIPIEIREDHRILFVDHYHGYRSIMAEAYLEIMRLWTVCRTGRWLFKRVASAGYAIESEFAKVEQRNLNKTLKPGTPLPVNEVLDTLLSSRTFPWSDDFPYEIQRLRERMLVTSNKSTGLHAADFDTYNLIVCFSEQTAQTLKRLQFFASADYCWANLARILVLPNCNEITGPECLKDPDKAHAFVLAIKANIRLFISQELGDWHPAQWSDTRTYRTLQLFLERDVIERLGGEGRVLTDIPKVREIEQSSNCKIKLTKYPNGYLASIICAEPQHGDANSLRNRLAKAEALLKGTNS